MGLRAARRALRVTVADDFAPLTEPPYVAALTPVANIAVGDETPWGIAAELFRLLPGTETGSFTGPDAGHEVLARPVRAASWPSSATSTGTPGCRRPWTPCWRRVPTRSWSRWASLAQSPGAPLHLATHGAARVCGRAAAEAIAGV